MYMSTNRFVHKCIHNSHTPSTAAVDHSGWVRLVDGGWPLWMPLWTACSERSVDDAVDGLQWTNCGVVDARFP
jgi:hypothetical protein